MDVCVLTNMGGGFPEASQFMTRSSTLKTVTDSGCVVMTGGLFTTKIKITVSYLTILSNHLL